MTPDQRDLLRHLDSRASTGAERQLLGDFATLLRVEEIYERYCREGKRPTRQEAEEWLKSLGWQPAPLAVLLKKWGYEE
jgi:hypothetical protein